MACRRYADAATKALKENNLGKAAFNVRMAKALASSGTRSTATSLDRQLQQAAEKVLADADAEYAAGKYPEALKTYEKLNKWLMGSPVGAKAKTRIQTAEKDPTVQTALRDVKAQGLMDKASCIIRPKPAPDPKTCPLANVPGHTDADHEGQDDDEAAPPPPPITTADVLALSLDKQGAFVAQVQALVRLFPECPTAQSGRELLDELNKDPQFQKSITEWQVHEAARQKFELGRTYQDANLKPQAIANYQELVQKYPNSEFAPMARKALKELGK